VASRAHIRIQPRGEERQPLEFARVTQTHEAISRGPELPLVIASAPHRGC